MGIGIATTDSNTYPFITFAICEGNMALLGCCLHNIRSAKKNNSASFQFERPFLYTAALQFLSNIMSFGASRGFRGGKKLLYLTFSSHDSEQARGGRGGFQQRDMGPPDQVLGIFFLQKVHLNLDLILSVEMGTFIHAVEDEMLCSSLMPDKVPYFNAPIYLQNKSVIGKVDEILGPVNEVYFSIKMGEGMVASSFRKGDKVYIGGDKLLPIERFLPKPKVVGGEE